MSPVAAFHAQLASIMEVLANTAVAEICELVDSGYSELQLEIARSRRENEQLRRKLRLMELRAARASALRALAGGGGARAPVPGHHGDHARRARAQRGEAAAASSAAQERGSSGPPGASGPGRATPTAEAVAPTIKTEDGGASWSPSELNQEFCSVVAEETEAPPTSIKQEVSEESDGSKCASWMCDVTSSCWSIQQTPNTDSVTTQNPLREEPGHSLALNATVGVSSDSGGGGLSLKAAVAERQQGAPLPPGRPQLPARKAAADRPNASHRRERGRHQDGAGRGSGPGRRAGSSRAFVCNCCGKTLASLKNLNTHMRVHTGEKPFVCTLCGKCFSDPSNLKRHQSVHTGEKRYGCVHCGKRFAQSGSLKVHMSVHTDCKQFRCSSCGKTFISGSHLRRHAAMHAAVHATERERPPPFSEH